MRSLEHFHTDTADKILIRAGDKAMKIFIVLLLFLFLGCTSSPPPMWKNPDKTDKELQADLEECRFLSTRSEGTRMGGQEVTDQSRLFDQCMKTRGYHLVRKEAKEPEPKK